MWITRSKYKYRFPSLHKNYGKPRFDRSGKRWSQPKMIEFIKSKTHWDAYDFKYELRITIDHSRYLLLLIQSGK
jgi:hypothetical protein